MVHHDEVMVVILMQGFPGIVGQNDDLLSQISSGLRACYESTSSGPCQLFCSLNLFTSCSAYEI